ncbi:unnamed protein product [Protopolystoma xenopodis]|uniref:Uncharacterized protein n=1 Tax=Protopolystoma xenopodis TaxID=117903 RepID=A0A448XPS7_9PLAT|nr:unnamed protein product [Protopolystoma xenopodis]
MMQQVLGSTGDEADEEGNVKYEMLVDAYNIDLAVTSLPLPLPFGCSNFHENALIVNFAMPLHDRPDMPESGSEWSRISRSRMRALVRLRRLV